MMEEAKVTLPVAAVMELGPTGLKVYAAVVALTEGEAKQVSVLEIATVAGVSERTVQRRVPELVDAGWLSKMARVENFWTVGQQEASMYGVVR